MNDANVPERNAAPEAPDTDRLDSWKEIAAYLRRDESTVRRWSKDGLPVHRHVHKSRAAVYAYKKELDAWWTRDRAAEKAELPATVAGTPILAPLVVEAGAADAAPSAAMRATPAGGLRNRAWLVAAALAVLAVAITAARLIFFAGHTRSAGPSLALNAFMNMGGDLSYPAFSPDGKQIAFSWGNPQLRGTDIFVKLVGSETTLQLTHDEGGEDLSATWSPDGRRIAFLRDRASEKAIFVVSALGGPERKLKTLRPDRYYTVDWSPDGKNIAFAQRTSANDPYCVFLLPVNGGEERQITFPEAHTEGDFRFAFSPDGKQIALLRHSHSVTTPASIELMPSGGGQPRLLWGQNEWIGNMAWSADSQSLVVTGNHLGARQLWRVYVRDGREERLTAFGEDTYFPAVAKQGNRIAFVRTLQDSDLWSSQLSSPYGPASAPTHVLSSTRVEGAPRFSPDGKKIAFQSYRSGSGEIWVSDPDGSNAVQLTFLVRNQPDLPSWSPDGQTIAFGEGAPYHLVSATSGQPKQLSADVDGFGGPAWSRDGRWIYFWKYSGQAQAQVWKVAVENGTTAQVTKNGGFSSMEAPDGKFLYFTKEGITGIWKMPVSGGEETLVMSTMDPTLPGYWVAFDDGIYYVNSAAKPQPTIEFYNFARRRSTRVLTMTGLPDPWFGGLTVSPDRRLVVFSQQQYQSTEIILGENFR